MSSYEAEYRLYLKRFDVEVGDVLTGEYGTWCGKLIKKLGAADYAEAYGDFRVLEDQIRKIMTEGLTLSDYVHDKYLESAARVLERPEEFL